MSDVETVTAFLAEAERSADLVLVRARAKIAGEALARILAHVEALEGHLQDAEQDRDNASRKRDAAVRDRVALRETLQKVAEGSWNHGNLMPGLTASEFARAVLVKIGGEGEPTP